MGPFGAAGVVVQLVSLVLPLFLCAGVAGNTSTKQISNWWRNQLEWQFETQQKALHRVLSKTTRNLQPHDTSTEVVAVLSLPPMHVGDDQEYDYDDNDGGGGGGGGFENYLDGICDENGEVQLDEYEAQLFGEAYRPVCSCSEDDGEDFYKLFEGAATLESEAELNQFLLDVNTALADVNVGTRYSCRNECASCFEEFGVCGVLEMSSHFTVGFSAGDLALEDVMSGEFTEDSLVEYVDETVFVITYCLSYTEGAEGEVCLENFEDECFNISCKITYNDEACNECNINWDDDCITADCSNVGHDEPMDLCTGAGLKGPFAFLNAYGSEDPPASVSACGEISGEPAGDIDDSPDSPDEDPGDELDSPTEDMDDSPDPPDEDPGDESDSPTEDVDESPDSPDEDPGDESDLPTEDIDDSPDSPDEDPGDESDPPAEGIDDPPDPKTSDGPSCYKNLRAVHAFVAAKDPYTVETVVLCPNTVFNVEKQTAIHLRSNTRYLCGEDGNSGNDCRLTGGSYQILNSPDSFGTWEDSVDVLLQGITFEKSAVTAGVLSNAGNVSFVDCIFEGNQGRGAVSMLYVPALERRRRLETTIGQTTNVSSEGRLKQLESHYKSLLVNETAWGVVANFEKELFAHRREQEEYKRQTVSFRRCLFQSNTVNSNSFIPNYGLVAVKSSFNDVVIDSCRFIRNEAGEPKSDSETLCGIYMMREASTLSVTNTCFQDNAFLGQGTITVPGPAGIGDITGNFASTDQSDLRCPFLAIGEEECVEGTATSDLCDNLQAEAGERQKRASSQTKPKFTASAGFSASRLTFADSLGVVLLGFFLL